MLFLLQIIPRLLHRETWDKVHEIVGITGFKVSQSVGQAGQITI